MTLLYTHLFLIGKYSITIHTNNSGEFNIEFLLIILSLPMMAKILYDTSKKFVKVVEEV
jgi:hypothetical protein